MFGFVLFLLGSFGVMAFLFWMWKAEERNKGDLCESCRHRDNLNTTDTFENSVCKSCSRSNLMYEQDFTIDKETRK